MKSSCINCRQPIDKRHPVFLEAGPVCGQVCEEEWTDEHRALVSVDDARWDDYEEAAA